MDKLFGVSIHVNGIVQGVGFRPFIFGLAQKYELTGWVRNTSSGVDIQLDGPKAGLESFIRELDTEAPPLLTLMTFKWIGNLLAGIPNLILSIQKQKTMHFNQSLQMLVFALIVCGNCLIHQIDVLCIHLLTAPIVGRVSRS